MKIKITQKDLLKRVSDFSQLLAKKYPVNKVYLFGSLAEGLFLRGSDVDLAVEGMNFEDYLKAIAEHREIKGTHIDLLHLDFCRPPLKETIIKQGKVLYEKS